MPGKGPSPIPTALLRIAGSREVAGRTSEPEGTPGCPLCPAFLPAEAKREWHRIAKRWARAGVIDKEHRAILAAYCQTWADYMEALDHVKREGKVQMTERGFKAKNPWVTILNESRLAFLRFAQELGLTPSAKSRVHIRPETKGEDLSSFIARKSG